MSIIKKSAIRGLSYLMPNYSGQIPFIITGSSGPFITGRPNKRHQPKLAFASMPDTVLQQLATTPIGFKRL